MGTFFYILFGIACVVGILAAIYEARNPWRNPKFYGVDHPDTFWDEKAWQNKRLNDCAAVTL